MAVERRSTPADESSGVLSGPATRSRVRGDGEFVRDHDRIRQGPTELGSVRASGGDASVDSFNG